MQRRIGAAPADDRRLAGPGRWVAPAAGLTLLAAFAWLRQSDPAAYAGALTFLMQRPWPHPFIDWEWIPTAAECWARGVDVYVDNVCYLPVPHGAHAYSPLWLRMDFLPSGPQGVAAAGVALAAMFFLSLAWLPIGRPARDVAALALAATSSLVVFALERGNVDIALFLLALLGARLWNRGLAARCLGYAVFLAMALLKFYPLILLGLAARERPRALAALAAASVAALAGFVWAFGGELKAALANMPPGGSWFTDLFGARNLPIGLLVLGTRAAAALGLGSEEARRAYGVLAMAAFALLLLALVVGAAWRLAGRGGVGAALAALPGAQRATLLVGAALICFCFFAGQNVGYRAIFLLLALPGLLGLSDALPTRPARRAVGAACGAILFVLWGLAAQSGIVALGLSDSPDGDASPAGMLHWLLRELAWWWLVAVLLATLLGFARGTPIWRGLFGPARGAA